MSLPDRQPRTDSFARRVLDEVGHIPGQARSARTEALVLWLAERVATPEGYSDADVFAEMERRRMTSDDLIMQCLPGAARLLGQRWTTNELSFAHVSLGSARLFGLCRSVSWDWATGSRFGDVGDSGLSFLICTVPTEDHTIASSVLSYALRSRGHSVCMMAQSSGDELVARIDAGDFDGVLFSSSTIESLATVSLVVKHIRTVACVQPLIALGGAVVHEVDSLKDKTGVDLVTNDINAVVSHVSRGRRAMNVVEMRGVAE